MSEKVTVAYRCGCGICEEVLSAASKEALSAAHVEHLKKHLTDYCEDKVADGTAVRVLRDGKTLYRFLDDPKSESPS